MELQEAEEAERLAAAQEAEDDEPGEVGENSKKINKKNQKKKKSIAQRKANQKKPQAGSSDLTSKVFATMEKHKEVFFTIRLHSAQSAARLSPIQDPDPLMQVQGEKVNTTGVMKNFGHSLKGFLMCSSSIDSNPIVNIASLDYMETFLNVTKATSPCQECP